MWGFVLFLTFVHALVPIPKPSGTYDVGHNSMELVDTSRYDPYASDHRKRAVVVSAFYPVLDSRCRNACLVEYMPPATAAFYGQQFALYGVPNDTLQQLRLQVCCDSPKLRHEDIIQYPVVLFSPGLGSSRLTYSIIAQSVSSSGYIVITIDHPYDAEIVEFPDGSYVLGANITSLDAIVAAVAVRAQDASFVLRQLGSTSVVSQLIPGSTCGLNTRRAAMFGHSLGGATTTSVMLNDSRFVGGINMDGSVFGPVVDAGLNKPYLLFNHEGYTQANDTTWAALWPRLRGWKRELGIEGTQHNSFTDLPILADVLGLRGELAPEIVGIIGTINGFRMLEVLTTYVSTFFDFVLKRSKAPLLDRPSRSFPEVVIVA